ncbi:gliding motility-associated C-terminal domain-containing protein [Flaviaesturariibacter amylovorans]|uniref:T9SS type B sorting domain-containing protein n=1 Tax=Flaviaesturariibacter amylovorans TaxID=1084520 RepID=A0ABP8H972_9BACT
MKLKALLLCFFVVLIHASGAAQRIVLNGSLNGTTQQLICGNTCTPVSFKTFHLKKTDDYVVRSINYEPYDFVTPTGTELSTLYADDEFGPIMNMAFDFCFYGATYNKAVVGSNGLITFDQTNANCANAYTTTATIPYASGDQCDQFDVYYPKATIFGMYTDLDPRATASASGRKIEWRVEGVAPLRRLVVSYYNSGMYGASTCGGNPTTFMIVAYESTSVVEVHIKSKACNTTSASGKTVLGIQNFNRNKAVAAPGKNATVWTESNTAYRFLPNAASLFVKSELYSITGTLISTTTPGTDTSSTTDGYLNVRFPDVCPTADTTQYVIKTYWASCTGTGQLVVNDTFKVVRAGLLTANLASTNSACSPSGTITVTPTSGTAPYTYELNGGAPQASGAFTALGAGTYNILVKDATGCQVLKTVTLTASNNLTAAASATSSGCAPSGSITVTPVTGTAPYTYALNGGSPQSSNVFNALAPGAYTVLVTDAASCTKTLNVTVGAQPPLTATFSTTSSGCAATGTITVNVTPGVGVAPFSYSLDGGTPQAANVLTGVSAGVHVVTVKDASGCTLNINALVFGQTMTATAASTASGCTPSGTITVTVGAVGTAPFTYALDGGTPQAANSFTGVSGGAHTVVVRDAVGCTVTVNVNVASSSALTATAASTPSGCQPADGTITVTVPAGAGAGPYTYALDGAAAQASNSFAGVAAGPHAVVVADGGGCTFTVNVTVGATPAVQATATSTPSGCNPIGTVTVNATGGTAPFQYSLGTGGAQVANTFNNVASGTHQVTVVDAKGCSKVVDVTVGAHPALTATATATPSGCTPPTGSITVTVPAGSGLAPFTYTLDGGTPQVVNTFNFVASGAHSVVVSDAAGCTFTVSATVGAPAPMTLTAATTATGCTPAGTLTVTVANGVAPYTYALNGGTPQASNVFSGLAAGSYNIGVTDAQGCTGTHSATVSSLPLPDATASMTPSGCDPTGTITVSVAAGSGTAPFTYALDGAAAQAANSFSSVGAGAHRVVVFDATGCTDTVDITVTALPALAATTATTPSSCTPSGSITVNVTAGTGVAPFSYSLDGGAPQATNVFTNVASGPHSITVRDAVGCSVTLSVTVADPSALAATTTVNNTSCQGASNGTVTLNPQNGLAPYEYRLGAGGWQTAATFTGLPAGTYDFYFRDAAGCASGLIQATVAAGAPLTATATQVNVTCFGGTNGSATLAPSANGTAPYVYSADNFGITQAGATFTGLAAGTHNFWVRDAVGCSGSVAVTITAPTQLVAGTPVVTDARCNGASDGSVTLSATGGTAPYSYSFNNSPFGASAVFTSAAGTFPAAVRDNNGCSVAVTPNITVGQPSGMTVTGIDVVNAACDRLGQLTVHASGGTAPYRYALDGGTAVTNNVFANVPAGPRALQVTDANNCPVPAAATVGLDSNLTYTRPVVDPICEGSKASIELGAPRSNATAFSWTGPVLTTNNASGSSVDVRPTVSTMYHVRMTLGRCTHIDSIFVPVRPAPVPDAGTQTPICFGQNAQLNAAPGYATYDWTPRTYLSGNVNGPNPNVVRPTSSIRYTLHVVDANGCRSLVPDTVTVVVTPPIIVRTNPLDTVAYIGDTIRVTASSPGTNYQWSPATGLSNPNVANPLILVNKDEVYRVRAWTDQGCAGETMFYLRAYAGPNIYVPDAFTPNRDGRNDLLRPVCVGVKTLSHFRVFNRWGQLMYEYKGERRGPEVYNLLNSNIGWDGTLGGKEVSSGTYVWIAEGVTKEGRVISRKGTVTIIR